MRALRDAFAGRFPHKKIGQPSRGRVCPIAAAVASMSHRRQAPDYAAGRPPRRRPAWRAAVSWGSSSAINPSRTRGGEPFAQGVDHDRRAFAVIGLRDLQKARGLRSRPRGTRRTDTGDRTKCATARGKSAQERPRARRRSGTCVGQIARCGCSAMRARITASKSASPWYRRSRRWFFLKRRRAWRSSSMLAAPKAAFEEDLFGRGKQSACRRMPLPCRRRGRPSPRRFARGFFRCLRCRGFTLHVEAMLRELS